MPACPAGSVCHEAFALGNRAVRGFLRGHVCQQAVCVSRGSGDRGQRPGKDGKAACAAYDTERGYPDGVGRRRYR